jgi:inosine-uridine nucleoside N-ribohydrolase
MSADSECSLVPTQTACEYLAGVGSAAGIDVIDPPRASTTPQRSGVRMIAARADIPVSAGAGAPLERKLVTATFHGKNGLGGIEFPVPTAKPMDEPATEIIHRGVSSSPGRGVHHRHRPLTNVASVLRIHPSLKKQVREIVLMG